MIPAPGENSLFARVIAPALLRANFPSVLPDDIVYVSVVPSASVHESDVTWSF